uniref:Uncharacterized protein n=1 Tax=Solanum tuberosum TaxID=4113 RepID=M1D9D9_SOLTU
MVVMMKLVDVSSWLMVVAEEYRVVGDAFVVVGGGARYDHGGIDYSGGGGGGGYRNVVLPHRDQLWAHEEALRKLHEAVNHGQDPRPVDGSTARGPDQQDRFYQKFPKVPSGPLVIG